MAGTFADRRLASVQERARLTVSEGSSGCVQGCLFLTSDKGRVPEFPCLALT